MVVAGAFAVAACSSGGGGSVEAFCAAVEEELVPVLEGEDPFDAEDIEAFNEQLDDFQSAIAAVADAAPDEISDQTDVLLANTRAQFDAFREIDDLTDEDQFNAVFEDSAFDEKSAVEAEDAQDAAQAYAEEQCDIVFPE